MEILKGVVRNLRHTASVSGTKEGISTSQIAIFEIEGRPVELNNGEPIFISDGDEVCIAGSEERGVFRGINYFNRSKGVKGACQAPGYWVLGTAFLIVPPIGLYFMGLAREHERAFDIVDQ